MVDCRDQWRRLTYARAPFTVWVVVGLTCVTVGMMFDIPTVFTPGWGKASSEGSTVKISLWTLCNTTTDSGIIEENCNSTLVTDLGKALECHNYTLKYF